MPVPFTFDNTVRVVTSADLTALNDEISTQNAAGYFCGDIKFTDVATALLLFAKTSAVVYTYPAPQRLTQVAPVQGDLDTDKAAQAVEGYVPTGLFPDPAGTLYVCYTQLTTGSGE